MIYKYKPEIMTQLLRMERDNFTWLQIECWENKSQGSVARDSTAVQRGNQLGYFEFLIEFDSIMETVTHDYGSFDSILSRLADKGVEIGKSAREVSLGYSSLTEAIKTQSTGGSMEQVLSTAGQAALKEDVPKFKVDSAYIYQDSGRRSYDLSVDLIIHTDRYNDIVKPVKKLQEFSCAEADGLIGIKFPAIFEIKTIPNELIHLKYCVLKSVQPTYNGPWVNGYPTHCKLQLSFEEVIPLYKRNITNSENPLIEVIVKTDTTERDKKLEDRKNKVIDFIDYHGV